MTWYRSSGVRFLRKYHRVRHTAYGLEALCRTPISLTECRDDAPVDRIHGDLRCKACVFISRQRANDFNLMNKFEIRTNHASQLRRVFFCNRSAIREFDRTVIKIPPCLLRDTDPLEMLILDKLRFHRNVINYLQEELRMHRLLTYGES